MASGGGYRSGGDGCNGSHDPYHDPTRQQQHLDSSGGGYDFPEQPQHHVQQMQFYGMQDVSQQHRHDDITAMRGYPVNPYSSQQPLNPYQQQQQQHGDPRQYYVIDASGQEAYYDDGSGTGMMRMQHPAAWSTQQERAAASTSDSGSYYFDSEFTPELLYGHAVSALAYDHSYECMYLSGTTQTMSSTRFNAHRSSFLMTYTTPSSTDIHVQQGNILFSSVAGHPEASASTLQAVYKTVYGISKVLATPAMGAGGRHFPPSHAYLPPYGGGELAENITAPHNLVMMTAYGAPAQQPQQQPGHMGINELLPLGEGYVASVSPSAVRIHSYGGLQLNDHNVEGMLSGSIHPHSGPGGVTHISVGGLSVSGITACTAPGNADATKASTFHKNNCNIHTLDLWQGLRPVYSRSFSHGSGSSEPVAATAMATSHERGSVVAGCTDGNIRLFDGSLRELATIKSHLGGVSSIAVSPDGLLIATTGYSSKAKPTSSGGTSTALYAFPDPRAYIYDIRYLGRGGISHPFAGLKGAPRFVKFMPDVEGCASNRLLVASGKPGGGMQIITPFDPTDGSDMSFLLPQLQQGESMTAFSTPVDDGDLLAVGTSMGRVLNFRLSGLDHEKPSKTKTATTSSWSRGSTASSFSAPETTTSVKLQKQVLEIPDFLPKMPALSLDPTLLQGDPNIRNGPEEMRSIFGTYILLSDPIVTYIGNFPEDANATFGAIGSTPIIDDRRRTVAETLLKEATVGEREFMLTVPTSKLGVDLLANQNVISKRYKGKKIKDAIPNPNKMLYNQKISSLCYEDGLNGRRKQLSRSRKGDSSGSSGELHHIPPRYKLQVRPGFTTSGAFDPSDYNDTGLLPGWDYDTSMPNAWVSPVLLLFYFIPEVRAAALAMQVQNEKMDTNAYEKALAPELGFVFHQMESLSRYGLLHPPKGRNQPFRPKIGAWVPSNLLTFISTMPEAEQLQVLDGSPAALDQPRRPESFYRFLAYQLDKEISSFGISPSSCQKLMDSLNGLDFFGCNQYIESKSSPPTQSVTRALTLDLNYDIFPPGAEKQPIRFGQLLQHSLCRATRLRAWNSKSHAYETIVQRKIATSLPKILTLSCACAGRKEEDGLWAWRTDHGHEPWLPEIVEVELLPDGNVQVTEFHQAAEGHGETKSVFRGKGSLPEQVSKMISAASSKQKYRYRLEAVLSFVVDNDGGDAESDDSPGHHVLHSRVAIDYKCNLLKKQIAEAWEAAKSREKGEQAEMQARSLVLSANVSTEEFEQRAAKVQSEVENMEKNDYQNDSDADWVLYNGFMVSKTSSEDARAFHVSFKEPVIVMFQAIDGEGSRIRDSTMSSFVQDNQECLLPPSAINPRSLSSVTKGASTGFKSKSEEQRPLAFDAEFVAVQEAETTVAEGGQKIVLRDTRHTLGRISVFDCVAQEVLIDDHVLPREPVVDYLTRFSGIIADDLNPSKARHRIISTRSAYLQLRYLLEKGCIFVGHGLKQDFATVNLAVPPTNILDTVEIFHQPGMRYISLRFLANYVLGRDMQQDVHDSVEDARAACELYQKALEWKQEGVWDERLREMYSYGDKTSWKLGVEESK